MKCPSDWVRVGFYSPSLRKCTLTRVSVLSLAQLFVAALGWLLPYYRSPIRQRLAGTWHRGYRRRHRIPPAKAREALMQITGRLYTSGSYQ